MSNEQAKKETELTEQDKCNAWGSKSANSSSGETDSKKSTHRQFRPDESSIVSMMRKLSGK